MEGGHLIFNAVACWGVFGRIKVHNTDNEGEKNFCRLSKIVNRLYLDLEGGHLLASFERMKCFPSAALNTTSCHYAVNVSLDFDLILVVLDSHHSTFDV